MKPPHAHINQCKDGHTDFIGTVKRKRPTTSILTRKKRNITSELQKQKEFEHVKFTFARINEIQRGGTRYTNGTSGCDRTLPSTWELKQRLISNRRPDHYAMDEHFKTLASMRKRMALIGTVSAKSLTFQPSDRVRNPNDPIAHPSLFFRREGQDASSTSIATFTRKVMRKVRRRQQTLSAKKPSMVNRPSYSQVPDVATGEVPISPVETIMLSQPGSVDSRIKLDEPSARQTPISARQLSSRRKQHKPDNGLKIQAPESRNMRPLTSTGQQRRKLLNLTIN